MRQVVQEINADYQSQIDVTKAGSTYDELEMSGSRAVWPEVLAVYAVKTTTDPDDPQEVATVDDAKKAILKDIFLADERNIFPHGEQNRGSHHRNRRRSWEHCGNHYDGHTHLPLYYGQSQDRRGNGRPFQL
ncbi:MAG: hypothetical protein ACLVGA_13260 [Dysosmobacter sp.]